MILVNAAVDSRELMKGKFWNVDKPLEEFRLYSAGLSLNTPGCSLLEGSALSLCCCILYKSDLTDAAAAWFRLVWDYLYLALAVLAAKQCSMEYSATIRDEPVSCKNRQTVLTLLKRWTCGDGNFPALCCAAVQICDALCWLDTSF